MNKVAENVSGISILFINLKANRHSRSRNYFHGLKKLGVACKWLDIDGFGDLVRKRGELKSLVGEDTKVVITSPSHVLVIGFVLTFFRRPVLDAGWPLYDGVITSRREFGFLGINTLKTFFIDFFAVHLSSNVLVESDLQKRRMSKRYLVAKGKLSVLQTGFDETRFSQVERSSSQKHFNVLFRGGAQEEAGLSVLADAARILASRDDLRFKVITNNFALKAEMGKHFELVNRYISDGELEKCFDEADLVLGQLSDHERLEYTIPHKFFEAAFLAKPYLTSNVGFMKVLADSNLVYTFSAGDSTDLAASVERIAKDRDVARDVGVKLGDWYKKNASQKVLSEKFKQIVCGD
jgi:hypothetical protein